MTAGIAVGALPRRPRCCWARQLLAAPADPGRLPSLDCGSPNCGLGRCRHTVTPEDHVWLRSVQDLITRTPDPEVLTAAILRRLTREGVVMSSGD